MGKKLALVFSLVFVVVGFHTLFHIVLYGTGISGIAELGISGLSIGKFSIDRDLRESSSNYSMLSIILLIGEWSILILLAISAMVGNKKEEQNNLVTSSLVDKYRAKTKTDLDVLYDILKEKKKVKIMSIARIFNVKEDIALNWAKALEAANLAYINYPRVGEPELVLEE